MNAARIVILDTETTGLPKHPEASPVEVAAVALDHDGFEVAAFSSLVRPRALGEWALPALELNGLTVAQVEAAPHHVAVAMAVHQWVAMLGDPPATSFNVAFDRLMLERMNLLFGAWDPCIMEAATSIMGQAGKLVERRWGPGWLWPKLHVAAAHFGVTPPEPAHRALSDARTAAGIWCAIEAMPGRAVMEGAPSAVFSGEDAS